MSNISFRIIPEINEKIEKNTAKELLQVEIDNINKKVQAKQESINSQQSNLDELIKVNGEICTQRGKKLYKGDIVEFNGESYEVV